MYPIHFEHQYEKYCTGKFEEFNRRLIGRIMPRLEAHVERTKKTAQVKQDAPEEDIFEFLENLRQEYGDWISIESIEGAIARNFSLIDAWTRDKTIEQIENLMARLDTPQPPSVTGRPAPVGKSGEKWLTTIDLLKRENGMAATQVHRTIKTNLNLVKSLQGQQFDDVYNAISEGLTRGDGLKTITDNIRNATGANWNRAKFWARDQASKFFGEITKTRQTVAGIPGYIWRISGVRTRDEHRRVANKYFTWTSPPPAGVRGNNVHPGEDFNCRCWAEPAFGPEYEDQDQPIDPLGYMHETGPVDEFKPAETIDAAESFTKSIGMANNNVNYSGLKIDTINRINESLFNIKQRYPFIKPVEIMETRSTTAAGKASCRRLMINKKLFFGKKQNAASDSIMFNVMTKDHHNMAMEIYERSLQRGNTSLIKRAKKELDRAKYYMNFSRNTVLLQNREYESVIYHEYGHVLSDQVYGMINGTIAQPMARSAFRIAFRDEWREMYLKLLNTNDIFKISAYAFESESECFAECFAMYHLEQNNVPIYVKDFIRKYFDNFTPEM